MFNKALAVSLPRPDVVPVMTHTFLSVGIELVEDAPLNIPNIIFMSLLAFILGTLGTKAVVNVAKARDARRRILDIVTVDFRLGVAETPIK